MEICYNAIFEYAEDGINIRFPDIPEAFTCAYTKKEAIKMAKEVLELILHKERYDSLPKPTQKDKILERKNTEVIEIIILMEIKDGVLWGNDITEFT